jgi:hypothetical protein
MKRTYIIKILIINLLFTFLFSSCNVDKSTSDSENNSNDIFYLSSEEDVSNGIDQLMYFWFYNFDEFQTWVDNGGDNYAGSRFVINTIKTENEIILPFLINSKYKFKIGEINYRAEETKSLLILTFESDNEDEYAEKYQAVNTIYIFIKAVKSLISRTVLHGYQMSTQFFRNADNFFTSHPYRATS